MDKTYRLCYNIIMDTNHTEVFNSKKVDLLENIARPFGINILESDRSYWDSIITVANAVDDLVDEDKVENLTPYLDDVRAGRQIPHLSLDNAQKFSEIYYNLTPERQARIERTAKIADYAILQSQTTEVDEYISLKMKESKLFSDSLKIDVEHDDYKARNRFNIWLPSFGKAFYAVDTFKDIKEDYEKKNTIIEPTHRVMLKLGFFALNKTFDSMAAAPFGTKKVIATMAADL